MKVAIEDIQSRDLIENKYVVKTGDYRSHLGTSSKDFVFTNKIKVN